MLYFCSRLVYEEKVSMAEQDLYYGNDDSSNFFSNFHNLGEINSFVQKLAKKYPDRVEIEMIGKSTEKRALNLMKIGLKSNSTKAKKIVWIDAGKKERFD